MLEFFSSISRYMLTGMGVIILLACCISLLKIKAPKVKPALFIDTVNSDEYPVTHWETSIGRSNSCDISLGFETVSRFHAVLTKQKKGWVITDTLSKTGTYVNGKKIKEPTVIKNGDVLIFGGVSLLFKER
ncbi:MAG: FHA domain-containing protein [Clostridia bacterium]|nr:FHA domain-containing protein [Clostridia bacterium]